MIPKTIHYCWFGHNPLPELAQRCIASWRKYLPDYEIKEWNEDNFDVNIVPYTREAYEAKKYAFVSDYARFWILYQYGGLYFDTDVEVIKPIDDIIEKGAFMGFEVDAGISGATTTAVAPGLGLGVNPGLGLGVNPGLGLYENLLDLYATLHFKTNGKNNLKTVVEYTTELLRESGLQDKAGVQNVAGVNIYPSEYFCPISVLDGKLYKTINTRTIHHYAASWQSPTRMFLRNLILRLGGVKLKQTLKALFKI